MLDLPPLESTIDVGQSDSISSQPPTLAGSSLPSASASMTPQTPLEAGLPASASQANTLEAFSEPARNDSVRHVAISKAPAFTCEACRRERPHESPRAFPTTTLLERHKKSHVRFACTKGCAKTFSTKKDRERHERNQHEGRLDTCPICGQPSRKDNIKRHMRRHESRPNGGKITQAPRDTGSEI